MNDDPDIAEAPREQIAGLEAGIEELAESLERCRKFDLASKVLITGGVLWLLAGAVGIVALGPTVLIGSIAATLGGIVLLGSNGSSMQQIRSAIEAAEARRAAVIGAIELRTVDPGTEIAPQNRWLH